MVPDISFAVEDIAGSINDWEVIDDFNPSDYLYITFSNDQQQQIGNQQRAPRWNLAKIDRTKFGGVIQEGER